MCITGIVYAREKVHIPVLESEAFGAAMLAHSANSLIALGKEEAIRVLNTLPKDDTGKEGLNQIIRISWLCRLLFIPKNGNVLRAPLFGTPKLPYKTMPLEKWKYYPLAMSEGVIFVLSDDYIYSNNPEEIGHYIDYCVNNGQFKNEVYSVPTRVEAVQALEKLLTSERWKKIRWFHQEVYQKYSFDEKAQIEFLKRQVDPLLHD